MPAPLTPEPPSPSSSVRRLAAASEDSVASPNPPPAEQTTVPSSNNPTPISDLIKNGPANEDDAPTIISSTRQKASPDAQHAEGLIGRKLGHFELIQSVGMGGMAAVIRAHDVDLGRTVALKILPPDMATDPENINRFKQEARAAARLDHENVARVYYCGEDQGLHFIAFEFVEGENLRVRMENHGGLLPVAESLHYLIQVTAGLGHAASRSVVHRDIKPSNIIITPEGKAKIVDMGLARNLDARSIDGQLTQSGVTLGTFDYISPEQAIEPRAADCRSDIYSLGCTFYHVMTGHLPVPEGTAAKKLHCHQHVAPLDPRELNPAIPDEMAAVLGKMMAKEPAQRYQHPDHLLQHLLVVAQKLNISTGSVLKDSSHKLSPYADRPLPSPPTLSSLWIAAAVLALAVGLFVISGVGGRNEPLDSTPFWGTENQPKDQAGAAPPKDGGQTGSVAEIAVPTKGSGLAANVDELISLLKSPSPSVNIKLKEGVVFDLTHTETGGEIPSAVFEGNDLTIEGNSQLPPTIKMKMGAADDGASPRPGSLTIRRAKDGSPCKLRIRGIRFEFVDADSEPGQTGLSLLNIGKIDVSECTFEPSLKEGVPQDGAAAIAVIETMTNGTLATFDRCSFHPGSVAVQIVTNGGQVVRAKECAFAPQFAVFRVQSTEMPDPSARSQIRLERCSVLMNEGAVFEIGNGVPCEVEAGWCLFSNPELKEGEKSQAFLVKQLDKIALESKYSAALTEKTKQAMPNAYQNIYAYSDGMNSLTFDECKTAVAPIPVEDATARILLKHPWKDERPVAHLYDRSIDMEKALVIDLKLADLRLEGNREVYVLGIHYLSGKSIYDLWPPLKVVDSNLAPNQKVWYPAFPGKDDASLPRNVYRSLAKAIVDLEKGDVILIRHNNIDRHIEMDEAEFKKPDTDVTIRPFPGCRPILVPNKKGTSVKKETAFFKFYSGQIVLEELQFELQSDRVPAVVSLPGSAGCTIRNCSVKLVQGEELAVVSLANPRDEMTMGMQSPKEWQAPKVTIENTYIRGRGRMIQIHQSRPFELTMTRSLAILDGSLIDVEPSRADMSEATAAQVSFDRVTTYLTHNLLHETGPEKRTEMKGPGLVQVQMKARQSLFVPATEQSPLIQLDRIDGIEQLDNFFQWRDCQQNVYGYTAEQAMLTVQSEPSQGTKPESLEREKWKSKWKEADPVIGEVSLFRVRVAPASKRYDGVNVGDFKKIPAVDPQQPMFEFGVPFEALPKTATED